ncbi:hypothetical protein SCUCBS95973_000742 [Sporothrix curviconia]|uniref:alpha-L-fucosidase n=1 Tax=Sporothrix curviconia TaxID=1260050 RepID=A0ABP0ASV3_9PEZI
MGLLAHSVPLDLHGLFNNKGIGVRPGEASFDRNYRAYPASTFREAAPNGSWTSPTTGVVYTLPGYTGPRQNDNVLCGGQRIRIPTANANTSSSKTPFSLSMLIAGDTQQETASGTLTLTYTSGQSRTVEIRANPAWSALTLSHGDIVAPYTWLAFGIDRNMSQLFEYTVAVTLPSSSSLPGNGPALASITLPDTRQLDTRIHVFAASLWWADGALRSGGGGQRASKNTTSAPPGVIAVQNVRPTQKWTDKGHQIVEVTLNNAGASCFSTGAGEAAMVRLAGDNVRTVKPGQIRRLCPGDQKRINIGIDDGETIRDANVTVVITGPQNETLSATAPTTAHPVRLGFQTYSAADLASLDRHESPGWFDGAKYGIFIHWGPYAVPGYGGSPDHEAYAEWFWWYSTQHAQGGDPADTYTYRKRTFGRTWAYDDGFANFSGSAWRPRDWVDLFADAGATYFVLTTKHHDGFALFDTGNMSDRNALRYGPKRDVLGELFAAAKKYQPQLKRGTYFSMPEWFNPDFGPYGFGRWLGQLAHNPFTGAVEPYTGKTAVTAEGYDYVRDLQIPQMETLAYTYETDILWCDCGPATNATARFAAAWWNRSLRGSNATTANGSASITAPRSRYQPVVNSRCGLPQMADFETPEYATYSSAQRRKWESNRGMDPFSYGYNRATPAASYMDAATLVYSLVDIVAKNGNLLLDIGPRADGTVVEAEAANLRAAGRWIRAHGEALLNTTYWFVQTEWKDDGEGSSIDVRFTQTDDAFYVVFLKTAPRPGADGHVVVDAPVPVQPGDTVSLLAVKGGEDLAWEPRGTGLAIQVSASMLANEQYAWVFKIAYGGKAANA